MKLKKIGEEKFKKYRRSWNISPPPISENDKNNNLFSPLNASIPVGMILLLSLKRYLRKGNTIL